jgi:hypothetical protein
MLYFNHHDVSMFILVYVDDIIVASSSQGVTTQLLHKLGQEFALKDLGKLHYFLGIEVNEIANGITLTQSEYASDLLQKVGMGNCKPANSPMSTNEKLSLFEETPLGQHDSSQYRSVVGALQYLTLTRHVISFTINKVCQFLHGPTTVHVTPRIMVLLIIL